MAGRQSRSDEEDLIDEEDRPRFEKVPTLPAAVIQVLLCIAQIVLVFLLPSLYDNRNHPNNFGSFSLLIYTHSVHWAAFLIIDQILHHHHHKSRLQGYLEFYVETKNKRRIPFYLLSVGNALLMIVVMVLHDLCDQDDSDCGQSLTKVDYLRGLITLESMVVMCIVFSYIYVLHEHNRAAQLPDILREECMASLQPGARAPSRVVGYRGPDKVSEVLERQAEMIRYLHEHTESLCAKIQDLTILLSQKERMA